MSDTFPETTPLPVVVVGAGPVGMAAAAHLAERGIGFLLLEAGDAVGAAVRQWGHVRLFSPWRYCVDEAARTLLAKAGADWAGADWAGSAWAEPGLGPDPATAPTGAELVERYLEPLAATPGIAPNLRLGHRVVALSRVGLDRVRTAGRESVPFLVRVEADGRTTDLAARAVIDATGTWGTPNVLGASGLPAQGEAEAAAFIDHALPDVLGTARTDYAGKHTLVVGSGHSAANTLLALAELAEQEPGTRISWAIRGGSATRSYGGGDADALPARGALGTRLKKLVADGRVELVSQFSMQAVRVLDETGHGDSTAEAATVEAASVEVTSLAADGTEKIVVAERIVGATGFRPDHSLAAELRLDLDPILGSTRALAPLIDPNEHSCGTVPPHGVDELAHPEPDFYAIGMKSYGRAPTFLLATGYEQARSVVAALDGDWDAARDVRLELPATGVCSTASTEGDAGCCGPSQPASVSLAGGSEGGLLSRPLTIVGSGADSGSGCCG
ncbi:NAD(P)-binding domain-containing protein [Catenulispora yoronensis]|uniref:NAD(P)-binding domain-containing protein n=1 Tax=Catenulispora yoronensis TaxID=450799 RepID=A0ABN2TWV2_9ACTN